MATQLTFRRGTSEPTQASGLTLGEPAFNTALSTFHIGRGAGVTAAWVGARISSLSADIAAGLTMQVPTMSAVKDYVASTTSGVATLNGLTGTVTLAAGTNIGVTTASGSITVTNLGVQTFNGATGAVTGASLGANTFTGLNTFNSGITTAFIYASTGSTFGGTLVVNGGSTFSAIASFNPGITTASIYASIGSTFASTLQVNGGATFAAAVNFTGGLTSSGSIWFRGTTPKNIFSTQASITIKGQTSGSVATWNSVTLPVDGSPLVLGSATENVNIQSNSLTPGEVPGLRIITDDTIGGVYGTIIKPGAAASAERTQTLQDASGVIALTSQLMGAVNGSTAATTAVTSFNGRTGAVQGVSAAVAGTGISVSGATGAVTITNIGVQSFNGATGAVTGASLGANTFTGLNTFNAGITTSFIYASTGSTFGARVDVAGVLDVVGGVTMESTSDHAGAARFASTITSTGTITANGGLTASTLDVTGTSRFSQLGTFATGLSAAGITTGRINTPLIVFGGTTGVPAYISGNASTRELTTNCGSWSIGNQASNGWDYPFDSTISGNPSAGTFIVNAASTLTVGGNGATFSNDLNVGGASRLNGGATASALNVTGLAKFNGNVTVGDAATDVLTVVAGTTLAITDHSGVARFASTVTATGAVTANGGLTASTLDVSGAVRTTGDMTVGATLTVNGNFFVTGTVTTVNRTDLAIDDKIITLGRTLGSDALATDGGLSLSGTAPRTWTWSNTRSAWESNQGVNVASTYGYAVNGTSVLTSSTLGGGVTTSSLQSLGTIGTGVWQATAIGATYGGTGLTSYTIGDVIYANGTSSLAKLGGVTAGYLLSANGTGTAPEYKQLLVKDGGGTSIATITSASGTLSAAIQYATASLKGVASFDNTNFTVSTGAVTITGVDGGTY